MSYPWKKGCIKSKRSLVAIKIGKLKFCYWKFIDECERKTAPFARLQLCEDGRGVSWLVSCWACGGLQPISFLLFQHSQFSTPFVPRSTNFLCQACQPRPDSVVSSISWSQDFWTPGQLGSWTSGLRGCLANICMWATHCWPVVCIFICISFSIDWQEGFLLHLVLGPGNWIQGSWRFLPGALFVHFSHSSELFTF